MRKIVLLLCLCVPGILHAQTRDRPIRAVLPSGTGAVPIHLGDGWGPDLVNLYADGPRIVFQTSNTKSGMTASYVLFANDTGAPTADSCRKAVMEPLRKGMAQRGAVFTDSKDGSYATRNGHSYPTTTYIVEKFEGAELHQYNIFAFAGDTKNCLEIHLSKTKYTAKDEPLFHAELELFQPDSSYVPETFDYFALATIFFSRQHEPQNAALYYQAALDSMNGSTPLATRRVITDQLVMSYGMSGDLKRSRAVAQQAIAADPQYPLNYYNLACADAEAGNATAAREHLKQAFDRRSNVIQGETMPDPSTDDSIMKLKSNKEFWSFVQSLPKK